MRFLGPHSAGEGPHLVPISLKFGSPSGPHFEKSGSPGLVGTVIIVCNAIVEFGVQMLEFCPGQPFVGLRLPPCRWTANLD